jgi:hypothetical protein
MRRYSVRVISAKTAISPTQDKKSAVWDMFELFLKYLPVISICAFVLGFFKVASYFESFNVNVLNYISASELLFSLLPLCTSIVICVYLPFYFSMMQHSLPTLKWNQNWPVLSLAHSILMLVIIGICLWLGYLIPANWALYRRMPYFRVALWLIPSIDYYLQTYLLPKKGKLSPIDVLIPLVLFGVALYCYGTYDATVVKTKGPDKSYTFKWKDKIIKSDSAIYIIGDVQNYLIFFRPKDSSTTIYKRSEIDSLVIKPLP